MKKFQFTAALAIAGMVIGSNAYAQSGTAVAAPAAASASGSDCSILEHEPGTYPAPVEVIVGDNADVEYYRVGFDREGDGVDSWENHAPTDKTRASFRVSRSYKAVRLLGFGEDGDILCEGDGEYVIASPAPSRRPARKAAAAATASPAWSEPMAANPPCPEDANLVGAPETCFAWVYSGAGSSRRVLKTRKETAAIQVVDGEPQLVRSASYVALVDEQALNGGLEAQAAELQGYASQQAAQHAAAAVYDHDQRRHQGFNPGLMRVGGWASIGTLGGAAACGIASLATGGLAAGFCIPALAIGSGGGAAVGVADALLQ